MNCNLSHCRNYFLRQEKIWSISKDFNIIFRIDIHTCDVEYICHLKYKDIRFKYLFLYNDVVYCVSDKGQQCIAEYDIKTQQINYYSTNNIMQFQSIVTCYNDTIYFFPGTFSGDIPYFDIKKKKFHDLEDVKKENFKVKFKKAREYDNYIFGVDERSNSIVTYDIVTGNWKRIWKCHDGKLSMVRKINNKIYACMLDIDKVVCIDENTHDIEEYSSYKKKDNGYHSIIVIGEKIFLTENHLMYYLDEDKKCIENVEGLPSTFDVISENTGTLFTDCCVIEGGYLLIPWNANMFLKYETVSNHWRGLEISVSLGAAIWYNLQNLIYEGDMDVHEYVEQVILNEDKKNLTIYDKENWGIKAIWKQ